MEKNKIKIYTDGSARGNPGRAGWAAIFILNNGKVNEIGGFSLHATNNQMELTAAIEALKHVVKHNLVDQNIEVHSDSKYVVLGITQWILGWQKNNWINSAKKPVLNRELWEELFDLTRGLKIKWSYVEGHNGDTYNERADEIATSFADGVSVALKK